jgi:hypothetical protein
MAYVNIRCEGVMSVIVIFLLAYAISALFRDFDLLERQWRQYGEERARERGGTSRWTDVNL